VSDPPPPFGALDAIYDQMSPQMRALGVETLEAGDGRALLRLPYKPEMVGDPATGVIAGGVVTTLLDHACGRAVLARMSELVVFATLDLRIDYMRPARPHQPVYARAHCYKMGRTVAFVRATAYEDSPDDPVAAAQAAFMLNSSTLRAAGRT
jgi:uncharacterized protein (TIGR00369 family)